MASYVDVLQGLDDTSAYKAPCRLATTVDLADNLTGLLVVDGVQTVAGDRILVQSQADNTSSGIWVAQAGAWTRAIDFSGSSSILRGTQILVTDGTKYGSVVFECLVSNPVIGTTPITFSAYSGSLSTGFLSTLPTTDPLILSAPWNNGGVLCISKGP